MRIVVQRVTRASVEVEGRVIAQIGQGMVLLVGIGEGDAQTDVEAMAEKVRHLRIFEDDRGKMNASITDVAGSVLCVSQFTLYGDCRQGRRPNFTQAAKSDDALRLYEQFNALLRESGLVVETGIFGADMQVSLCNDGPVTLLLDSRKTF